MKFIFSFLFFIKSKKVSDLTPTATQITVIPTSIIKASISLNFTKNIESILSVSMSYYFSSNDVKSQSSLYISKTLDAIKATKSSIPIKEPINEPVFEEKEISEEKTNDIIKIITKKIQKVKEGLDESKGSKNHLNLFIYFILFFL